MQTGARALDAMELAHSYGPDCPHCGDGKTGTDCDLRGYSVKRVRFIKVPLHLEEYRAAYINPGSAASRNILQRLEHEYRTLPPRHSCSCWPGHCSECKRLHQEQTGVCPSCLKLRLLERPKRCVECARLDPGIDVASEIGRTQPVHAAMPSPTMLDLARAEDVLGSYADPGALARYMSFDGADRAHPPLPLRQLRPVATLELRCLMCAREAAPGQRECRVCGGSLIAEETFSPVANP